MEKRLKGKFYTISNPFLNNIFFKWYNNIPNIEKEIILEPFAGTNNLLSMLNDLNLKKPKSYKSFDIEPPEINNFKKIKIQKRDTILDFPKEYNICITNPPYLAKNKFKKMGKIYSNYKYQDLYLECLHLMLKNCKYVACIIPESFITKNIFKERLFAVVSLEVKLFEDTQTPVCLALFVPEKTKDFEIYKNDIKIGNYSKLKKYLLKPKNEKNIKFNDPNGNIGIICVDNNKENSIRFVENSIINPNKIKISSRSKTLISGIDFKDELDKSIFIDVCNEILEEYRYNTKDVFLTPFKGLRKDYKYRRRLDFKTAKQIISIALEKLQGDLYE